MKVFILLLLFITTNSSIAIAQQSAPDSDSVTVRFEVIIPESTPENATIFWAGSLNSWDPGDKGTGFGAKEYARPVTFRDGKWSVTLTAPKGTEESYKYTRGSIYSAEEQADYTYRPTRTVTFDEPKTVTDTIEAWHDIPPESLDENWPLIDLTETDITISHHGRVMDKQGGIIYDRETGARFFDMEDSNTHVESIPENFHDAVYYYQQVSPVSNEFLLLAAVHTKPEGLWHIFVDQNRDKELEQGEQVLTIQDEQANYKWTGNIPVHRIVDNELVTDSVEFTLRPTSELPAGYTSSAGTDAPDLTYQLPLKKRKATIGGQKFYVSTPFQFTFSRHHQLLIDQNDNDTLETGSGSNEVYSSDLSQMHRTQKYFLYPSIELAGNSWQIANIDPHGEWIRLRPARDMDEQQQITEGKPAPDWQATTVSGENISSQKLEGNYLLLDFWGSWCGPCIEEIPLLQKVYQQFQDHNFELVGFAYESRASLDNALDEYDMPWPQILDNNGRYSTKFLVRGYPTKYFIGPDGNVLETGYSLRGEELISTLSKHLN